MRQEGDDSRLFFRGFQNRSQEKMKLRKRKSTLYLSPRKSTLRHGGEGVGAGAGAGRGRRPPRRWREAADPELGLHLLGGVAKEP